MIQAGERDGAERFDRRGFGVDRDLGSGHRRASLTGAQRITALWLRSRTVGDLDRAGEALGDPRQRCSVTLLQLDLDLADRLAMRAGPDMAAIHRDLHVGAVEPDRQNGAFDHSFEYRLQLPPQSLCNEMLKSGAPGER